MKALGQIVARDLLLAARQGSATLLVLAFFVVAVTLFPLGLGPGPELLARIAAGALWVAALLAALLALDRLFQADVEDGSLEQIALVGLPLELVVLAKAAAHWLTTGLPLLAIAPLLGLVLNLPADGYWALMAGMALGTPSLSLVGGIGAALTVNLRRGGVLLSLLVLPLYVPVLIFGVGAVEAAVGGLAVKPYLLILLAGLSGAVALAPWASAAALRLALE
jgi:heme exporter protein B